jgi:hypothetical protein
MAAPTIQQHKSGFVTTNTTMSVTFSSNVTAGNMILIWVGADVSSSVTINTPTMTGETFTKVTGASNAGTAGGGQIALYATNSAVGGQSQVTVTTNANSDIHTHIIEVAGPFGSPQQDATGNTENTSMATTGVSTSGATTVANDLVIAFFLDFGLNHTLSATSPYTQIEQTNDTTNGDCAISASNTVSSTGTQTAKASGMGTDKTEGGIIAIAGTGGGGGPTTAQLSPSWYQDGDGSIAQAVGLQRYDQEQDFANAFFNGNIIIPTLAWDEIEWQRFTEVRISELTPENEQPTEIPPVVFVWNPAFNYTQGDDWDWSKNYDTDVRNLQFDHEEWPTTYASLINIFDDFEPEYGTVIYRAGTNALFGFEDEQPTALPIIPSTFQRTQFDDYDWSRNFDLKYAPITFEEDTGFRPIFIPLPTDEGIDQKFFALFYIPQPEDDNSQIANFPPPPLPTNERNEEESWQHFLGYQLSQGTEEEFQPPQQILPTLAWDEIEWQRYADWLYTSSQVHEGDEDQTFGWFLNPFIPPPPPFCPLPPSGPDSDISLSIFGGAANPTLALFCRICRSGRPLVVRADYAIWCQDCCAFVSKQDTYMGTVQAPGVFRSVF